MLSIVSPAPFTLARGTPFQYVVHWRGVSSTTPKHVRVESLSSLCNRIDIASLGTTPIHWYRSLSGDYIYDYGTTLDDRFFSIFWVSDFSDASYFTPRLSLWGNSSPFHLNRNGDVVFFLGSPTISFRTRNDIENDTRPPLPSTPPRSPTVFFGYLISFSRPPGGGPPRASFTPRVSYDRELISSWEGFYSFLPGGNTSGWRSVDDSILSMFMSFLAEELPIIEFLPGGNNSLLTCTSVSPESLFPASSTSN